MARPAWLLLLLPTESPIDRADGAGPCVDEQAAAALMCLNRLGLMMTLATGWVDVVRSSWMARIRLLTTSHHTVHTTVVCRLQTAAELCLAAQTRERDPV
jgi:hypothetical protein